MRISSVRLGHATNSSSTHSILLGCTAPSQLPESYGDYGWEWFHLTANQDKRHYLAVMIKYALLDANLSSTQANAVVKELLGAQENQTVHGPQNEGYAPCIDHQSIISFPQAFGKQYLDDEFLSAFSEHILSNPDISIGGGNDNEDDDSKDFDGTRLFTSLPHDSKEPLICRKDKDWWILFNQKTGAKIRLSFKEKPVSYRASTPELVDMKITSYCSHACAFCYQESTAQGFHADTSKINVLFHHMMAAKVFEVALGGGEPTSFPDFAGLLETAHHYGITPNFSTFDMSWTHNTKIVDAVLKCAGKFAISNPKAIRELVVWNEKHWDHQGNLQLPLGCYASCDTQLALWECNESHIPVTLLGFKPVGRGATFEPNDYAWIFSTIKKYPHMQIGADTLFVQQFKKQLLMSGVSEKLMVGKEGEHSCYIDALKGEIGPCSYTDDMKPIDDKNLFARFPFASKIA